ncbi:MAG TPA: SUMF1/EgtB/PvdO family nonheme iron enzyme [Chitinophagaceae bacterium]|nr:SUMF1/EgtB/PvdO family nonheme iron enzyme [Chitinophagaceae bacterium]
MKKTGLIHLSMLIMACSFGQTISEFKPYEQPIPGSSFKTKMIPVQGGTFLMGSSDKDKSRRANDLPQHSVNVSPFWMGAYEVSRDEFDVFYKDETLSQNSDVDAVTRPSAQYIDFSGGMGKEGGYPVNSLSQYAALMYCKWLYVKTGIFYRLPTEAEWEYACRAGSTTTYFFGNDSLHVKDFAWYKSNSNNKFEKAGQKKPNAWGLYDMPGNVMEWTLDHYYEKLPDTIIDSITGSHVPFNPDAYPKVLKGGGYNDEATDLRSASRVASDPEWNRRDPQIPKSKWWLTDALSVGFRIIRPFKQPTAAEAEQIFRLYLGQ